MKNLKTFESFFDQEGSFLNKNDRQQFADNEIEDVLNKFKLKYRIGKDDAGNEGAYITEPINGFVFEILGGGAGAYHVGIFKDNDYVMDFNTPDLELALLDFFKGDIRLKHIVDTSFTKDPNAVKVGKDAFKKILSFQNFQDQQNNFRNN